MYNIFIRQIVNCCVAVFIFLSGYFTNIEKIKNNKKEYITKKIKMLIIPYIIWSIIYFIIKLANNTISINAKTIVLNLFFGYASAQLYYILVLIQLILIAPIIINIKMKHQYSNIFIFLITPIYIICMETFYLTMQKQIPLYATFFMAWIIFYYLGIMVRERKIENIKLLSMKKSIILIIVTSLFSWIEGYIYNKMGLYNIATSQIKISTMLYSLSIINLIVVIKQKMINNNGKLKNKILEYIGKYSFGIYLCHLIIVMGITQLLEIFKIKRIIIINEVFYVIITLTISITLIKVFEKTKLKKLFGVRE